MESRIIKLIRQKICRFKTKDFVVLLLKHIMNRLNYAKTFWSIAPTQYAVSIVTVESIAMWSWSYRGKTVLNERIVKHSSANLNNFIIELRIRVIFVFFQVKRNNLKWSSQSSMKNILIFFYTTEQKWIALVSLIICIELLMRESRIYAVWYIRINVFVIIPAGIAISRLYLCYYYDLLRS